jgi:hypothetical protein
MHEFFDGLEDFLASHESLQDGNTRSTRSTRMVADARGSVRTFLRTLLRGAPPGRPELRQSGKDSHHPGHSGDAFPNGRCPRRRS